MTDIKGKIVLITGAGSGIGQAIAQHFASEKTLLVLVGRNLKSLEATAALCKEKGAEDVQCFSVDLTDRKALDHFCQEQISRGGVDVLVNNAGYFVQGHALDGDIEEWEWALNLNLLAPMHLTRRFSPPMKEKGDGIIINLGSVAALEGLNNFGAYCASKHGLRGWSRSCYQQLREFGIKVVLINPAFVDTKMTSEISVSDRSKMIQADDVAQAAMLAIRTSPACCPDEINLRLTHKL